MPRANSASFRQAMGPWASHLNSVSLNFLICKTGISATLLQMAVVEIKQKRYTGLYDYILFIEHLLCVRHMLYMYMCLSFLWEGGVTHLNILEQRRSRKFNKDTPEMGILTYPSQTLQQADLCFSQASLTSGSENLLNIRTAMAACGRSGCYKDNGVGWGVGRALICDARLWPHGNWQWETPALSSFDSHARLSLMGVSSPRAPAHPACAAPLLSAGLPSPSVLYASSPSGSFCFHKAKCLTCGDTLTFSN